MLDIQKEAICSLTMHLIKYERQKTMHDIADEYISILEIVIPFD